MTGDAAHGEARLAMPAPQTDHGAVENLDTFAFAFHDAHVHTHGVTGAELRVFGIGLGLDGVKQVSHRTIPYQYYRAAQSRTGGLTWCY
jgi:hypothetical protein